MHRSFNLMTTESPTAATQAPAPNPAASSPADSSPTPASHVSLRRNDAGNRVLARVVIGEQSLAIDQNWLNAELQRAGLTGAIISKNGILKLQRMVASREAGEVEIGECHDAVVGIQVSEDRLTAKLVLKTARGGTATSAEDVAEVVDHAKLASHLIDHQAIERLLAAAPTATPGTTLQIVIARGKAAIDGKNSEFETLVPASDRRPAERADGSLDYRDLGAIPAVQPGDLLMRRHPPTKGVEGYTVNGNAIKAKDGRLVQFKHLKGSAVSDQDPDLLVATITGQPVIQPAGASVDPVLKVEDVNLRSGNIDYDGSLIVRGSVSPGMQIRVSGDARILGMVECAELRIGGNLDVKMGISGPSDDNHGEDLIARIHCDGNLSAAYIEKAELFVKGDITIKSRLNHSQVVCQNQVVVGSTGQPRSGIIGGRVQAAKLLRTQNLGAEAGIATEAVIHCAADVLHELENHQDQIACKQADLGRLLKIMVELSQSRAPDREARANKINKTCEALKTELNQLSVERDRLQQVVDASLGSCIEIPGTLYPRVTLAIGDRSIEVEQAMQQVSYCREEGGALKRRPYQPKVKKKSAR
jgi:uncharacterized protein (DUF342 family)